MKFRRLLALFITLCYVAALLYAVIYVSKQPSSLHHIYRTAAHHNVYQKSLHIAKPIVSTGNVIYFFSYEQDSVFLYNFHIFQGNFNRFFVSHTDLKVIGCASDPGRICFLVKFIHDTSQVYKILIVDGDTSFRTQDITLPDLPLLFFQLHNNNIYFAFQQEIKPHIRLFVYNIQQRVLRERDITYNQFYLRISTPFAVYYDNGSWYFFAVSNYYRKDNLYVKTYSGAQNVMTFRSNLSFHVEDQLLNDTVFDTQCVDYSFAGLFSDIHNCSKWYSFEQQSKSFQLVLHPYMSVHQQLKVVYTMFGDTLSPFYLIQSGDTLTFLKYTIIKRYESGKALYFNANTEIPFARSYSNADYIIVPIQNGYLLLLEDGHYCVLTNSLERADDHSAKSKLLEFLAWQLTKVLSSEQDMKFWSIPFILFGYPLATILAFIFYLLKLIFFTPQKSGFSLRKRRKVYFSSYWLLFLLIWLLGAIFFVPAFLDLLMTF